MKRFSLTMAIGLLSTGLFSTTALAQAPAQAQRPAPAAQQAAARDVDPNTLANTALQLLQAIDRDQAGALWDASSSVTKRSAKREDFVAYVGRTRKPLGTASSRSWIGVRREVVGNGAPLPPGLYASIEFSSQFQGKRTAKELISLRQDEDGLWRFSGYVIQ